ncbi:D-alanyl-D-alanine dipeptidase [Wilcoxina mikolae CBS 423.85]|nr:D-alanyl-D-alanine dipeptidase [Wilcoxina mikolae CBS 423.85]
MHLPKPPTSALPTSEDATSSPDQDPIAPPEFVSLESIDPTIIQEMRYTTQHNFIGDVIDGYQEPLCILTRPAAEALKKAQRGLLQKGYSLKVYDGYRPQRAVDHFVRWAEDPNDTRMRDEYYPRVDKSRLFKDGYIAACSGHSRGSTVDLTLVKWLPEDGEISIEHTKPKQERYQDDSIDMGTGFDFFDTLSWPDDPRIVGKQKENRELLRDALEEVGFVGLRTEWWHFTYQPELFPETFFDFPVARKSLRKNHEHPPTPKL